MVSVRFSSRISDPLRFQVEIGGGSVFYRETGLFPCIFRDGKRAPFTSQLGRSVSSTLHST